MKVDSLSKKDMDRLHTDYRLYDGVLWDEITYYKDEKTNFVCELRFCFNDSWNDCKFDKLQKAQEKSKKVNKLLKYFDIK